MIDILIVEDDLLTRIGITSIINQYPEKYRVIGQADNGKDALDICDRLNPHIILTDIKMPIVDGITLITTLKAQNFNGRIIILSAYNDFDYVREGMRLGADDYLLKLELNPDNLCAALDHAATKLDLLSVHHFKEQNMQRKKLESEQLFAYHAFTREYGCDEELKAFGREMEVFDFPETFYCLLIEYPLTGHSDCRTENTFFTLFHAAQNLLHNFNLKIYFDCIIDINIGGFIISTTQDNELPVNIISEMKAYFVNTFNSDIRIYLSLKCTNLCAVSQFFLSNFKRSDKHYISTQIDKNTIHTDSLKEELNIFSKALSDGSISDILRAFDIILDAAEKKKDSPPKMFHGICHLMVHFIDDYIVQVPSADIPWVRTEQTLYLIKNCHTSTDYIHYIVSLKELFLHSQDKIKEPAFIRAAKDYVLENYKHNLQIEDIAKHIHVSTSYLSKSFSNVTGDTITEYINAVRIKAAKKLLRETEAPIYQISEDVGYNSSYYFCRIFKKATGVTPLQYRNHTGAS